MSLAKRLLRFLGGSLIVQMIGLSLIGYYVLSNDEHSLPPSLVQSLTKVDQKVLEGVALQNKLKNETARNLIAYELLELNGVDDVEFLDSNSIDQLISKLELKCRIVDHKINVCLKPNKKDVVSFVPVMMGAQVVGHLKLAKALNNPFVTSKDIVLVVISIVITFLLNITFIAIFWFKYLRPDLHKVLEVIHSGVADETIQSKEYLVIQDSIVESYKMNKEAENERVQLERAVERENISKQVVHDIQSPLAAIERGLNRVSLNSSDKDFFTKVLERTKEILSELSQGKSNKKAVIELKQFIRDLVNEKVVEHKDNTNVSILFNDETENPIFTNVVIGDFGRSLSNLINNAVEATSSNFNRITVSLSFAPHLRKVIVSISDHGKGIEEEKLNTILETGESFEKPEGSGIGLATAQKFAQENSGTFNISSLVGQGTIVTIALPICANVVERGIVEIKRNAKIIVVDDEHVMHLTWKRILKDLPNEASYYFNVNEIPELDLNNHYVIFSDYDFGYDEATGIDCYLKAQSSNATFDFYLVTGTDLSIIETASLPAIIPKINLENVEFKEEKNTRSIVLLDNEEITHLSWGLEAEKNNLNLISCYTIREFIRKLASLKDKDTPIYIDLDLDNEENGIEAAEQAAELGFKNLVLTTGYDEGSIQLPAFIQRVQGKDFPSSLS